MTVSNDYRISDLTQRAAAAIKEHGMSSPVREALKTIIGSLRDISKSLSADYKRDSLSVRDNVAAVTIPAKDLSFSGFENFGGTEPETIGLSMWDGRMGLVLTGPPGVSAVEYLYAPAEIERLIRANEPTKVLTAFSGLLSTFVSRLEGSS